MMMLKTQALISRTSGLFALLAIALVWTPSGANAQGPVSVADLAEKLSGAVVNISSHSGFSGIGSSIAYAASKGALNTLTLSPAPSLAPDIRVNAVCPGFVDTDWMAAKLQGAALKEFKRNTAQIAPLKRIVSVREIAEATRWFALGGASITGQLLVVDGGTHLTVGAPL